MAQLSKERILSLFDALNTELVATNTSAELHVVGGAVMCLAFDARPSTNDVDAQFRPSEEVRKAARAVAKQQEAPTDWLNDGAKGFFSANGDFDPYLSLSNVAIFTAVPEYLLAMKCLAMRIGEEFHDVDDVRFLLRSLNIRSYQAALDVIQLYYPLERFPQKTLYALEEILQS